jgi:hypothetical protein
VSKNTPTTLLDRSSTVATAADDGDFGFNEVASAELRAAAIAETLASPDVDAATKDRLLASALQSQRELEDLGEYEAASKYNGIAAARVP